MYVIHEHKYIIMRLVEDAMGVDDDLRKWGQ